MAPKRRSNKAESSIDAKHRALLEQQEALVRKQKELERLLQEAPNLKKIAAEKRRDETFGNVSKRSRPMEVIPGRRQHVYKNTAYATPPRKLLRVERREAQLKFVALLALLTFFLFFLARALLWS